jgi:hypothetical protein
MVTETTTISSGLYVSEPTTVELPKNPTTQKSLSQKEDLMSPLSTTFANVLTQASSNSVSPIVAAQNRTDQAARKVEQTTLSDDKLKDLNDAEQKKKIADSKKANEELQAAVENEIKTLTGAANPQKLTYETLYASATAAIIDRVENQSIQSVVTAQVYADQLNHTFKQKGSLEASKFLDELTTAQPEMAAQIITRSKATIDEIGKTLGSEAVNVEAAWELRSRFPENKAIVANFDDTVLHLSNACYNAALNAKGGGASAIDVIASAIAANVPKNDIGRFDEAFQTTVRGGGGVTLGLAVADKLQKEINAGARKDTQADNVINGIKRGVDDVRKEAVSLAEKINSSHVGRLLSGYSQMYLSSNDPKIGPAAALENFKKSNSDEYKDYEALLKQFNTVGAVGVRTEQSLLTKLPSSIENLSHADDLIKAKKELESSTGISASITSSAMAEKEIMKIAQSQPIDGQSVLDLGATTAGIGKTSYEAIGKAYISGQTKKAVGLAADGDLDGALKIVRAFKEPRSAAILGIEPGNNGQAQIAIDKFEKFVREANDIKNPRELVTLSDGLEKDLKGLGFDQSTQLGRVLRGSGLILSLISAKQSLAASSKEDAGAKEAITAAASTLGFGKDVSEIFLKDAFTEKGAWKGFGKGLVAVGIFLDLQSFSQNMFSKNGDKIDGIFDGMSAAGGGIGLAGLISEGALGGYAGPIGLAVTVTASLGKFGYGLFKQTEEINLLENSESTQKFLTDLGFEKNVAKILSNTNDKGLSPIPTLSAWAAEKYGYDFTKQADKDAFVTYLNSFESKPKELDSLVKKAHLVERNNSGGFKTEYTQTESDRISYNSDMGKGPLADFNVQSLSGLDYWIRYHDVNKNQAFPSQIATPEKTSTG